MVVSNQTPCPAPSRVAGVQERSRGPGRVAQTTKTYGHGLHRRWTDGRTTASALARGHLKPYGDRFARPPAQFWANIVAGRDCTREVPEEWWPLGEHHDPDVLARDKTYSRRGGFLPSMTFDPLEFGMPPASLDSIGLVQLLSLLAARDVLRDAGCPDAAWYDPARIGVVLGVCGSNSTALSFGSRLVSPETLEALRVAGVSGRQADEVVRRYLERSPEWTEDSFPRHARQRSASSCRGRAGAGRAPPLDDGSNNIDVRHNFAIT
ncbi:hypothetical protein OG756_02880 [Streptomyces sp. NBC_01310]|uniref:beta-ketoacyl synthase N-terminal-like domain-containing protein n=1 Tax=Streptomyces sp. NBC_01310 TaxID=2903820 RepID=UPI0035B59B5B|nr:hypothetical protein OG756_02880 [Streptomyces sp. NBC_01310]